MKETPAHCESLRHFGAENGEQLPQVYPAVATGKRPKRKTEADRTKDLEATLPRGVYMGSFKDGRRKPWFYRAGADRKVHTFETEADRNDSLAALLQGVKEEGTAVLSFDAKEWRAWADFKKETGATLQEVKTLWQRFQHTVRATVTVRQAVHRYLDLRRAEGIEEKGDTYRHYKKHLVDCLSAAHGDMLLAGITKEHITALLSGLKDRKGKGPASDVTRRNYRKDFFTFFEHAVIEKWVTENPVKAVKPPRVVDKEKAILPLREVFAFFKEAVSSPIGARLAVEAFAGLRVSSSARMEEHEVRIAEGGIELPAGKHKLEKRFFVQGFPANVFKWLDLPDQRWDISESTYDQYKARVFDRSGVKNPGNVLRHSFCTYHIAAYGDAGKTATLLTHRGTSMLYRHYLGRGVTKREGLAYFAITPDTVKMTFDDFLASIPHNP